MTVYIEYVIIDNMVLDYLLLSAVAKIARKATNKVRLFFAAAFGTAVACVLPLIGINGIFSVAAKLLCGLIMIAVLSKHFTVKQFLFCYAVFLGLTFVAGGAALALIMLIGGSVSGLIDNYSSSVPVGLLALFCALCVAVFRRVASRAVKKVKSAKFVRTIEIFDGQKSVKCSAFLDSGNRLTDQKSSLPVVIVDAEVLGELLDIAVLSDLIRGREPHALCEGHFIGYSTLSGKNSKIFVYKPTKLKIYSDNLANTIYDVMIGVDVAGSIKIDDCKALLSPLLVT